MKVLVLGGKGEIGTAVAARLERDGFKVTPVGKSDFDLAEGPKVLEYIDRVGTSFDIVVHSAGWNVPKEFEVMTDVEIRHSLDANVLGFLTIARACIPYWRAKLFGRIVVVSSLYGFLSRRGRLPYVASKHALNGVVKTLAIELAPYGVLTNSVSPGYIATKLTYRNNSKEVISNLISGIPVGRLGYPNEIAEVVAFLCSGANTYINGQNIVVDGGYSIGGFQ